MYINFNTYRITSFKQNGTGFISSIYKGNKVVGTCSRKDGEKKIEDIKYDINSSYEREMKSMLKAKKHIKIDDVDVIWSIELMIFCLIENKKIIDHLKEYRGKKITLKYEDEDQIKILNLAETPQNIQKVKKDSVKKIQYFGSELIQKAESYKE